MMLNSLAASAFITALQPVRFVAAFVFIVGAATWLAVEQYIENDYEK